jgi:N-acetylmuramoyl-L-alanine amidase
MPSRTAWLLGLGGLLAALSVSYCAAHPGRRAPLPRALPDTATDVRRWPGAEAALTPVAAVFPKDASVIKVALDPGHGAPNNRGNTSSYCVDEQDAMLALAQALADRLEATGHIAVRLTRDGAARVDYPARVEDAAAWGADAFVSLHSDVRGKIDHWAPAPELSCPFALDAPGFAVLYSDEGDPALAARRFGLGRAVAARMIEAGFFPYGGAEYAGIYAPGDGARGVFADRHEPGQRIFVLRKPAIPSILIETHNALDPREVARWSEPETLDAFASAVAAALADALAITPHRGGT